MSIDNYRPIITEATKNTFFDYISCLDIPEIDYFAIGLQNLMLKKSISLMSRPEWQQLFCQNNYANSDPIRRATLFTKRNIIPFNEVDFVDNIGKEIMRQRTMLEIKSGLILMHRCGKHSYMITLGTAFSKFDAYDFLKRHHDKINILKNDFIKIIQRDAKGFLPEVNLNHLLFDAK